MIRQAWYAAGWSHELKRAPIGRKLVGRELALFRDTSGKARAIDATCPHRGASLAAGRVVNGVLECPYHGWRFDGGGRCVLIPSQPATNKIPDRANVVVHHLVEAQGMLWLWGGADAPPSPPPSYDFWRPTRPTKRYFCAPRLLPLGFAQVAEQTIDQAHAPFVHRGSIGDHQELETTHSRVDMDADGRGFLRTDEAPSLSGNTTLRSLHHRLLGLAPARSVAKFELGGMFYLLVHHANGGWDVIIFQMTPADEDNTWFFAESVRTHSRDPLSGRLFERWFERVVAEDTAVPGYMLVRESGLELPVVSVAADAVTLAFRKMYRKWALAETVADSPPRA